MKSIIPLMLCATSALSQEIASPEQLIRATYDRYHKTWYTSVVFTQRTVETSEDGTKKESIWFEKLQPPSRLNIRFKPVNEGDGILFVRDSIFIFEKGELTRARPTIHPLLVLGFDLYSQPAERTIAKLKELRFDMTTMHESTWQGKPVYVVGAKMGDDTTKQFWLEKERLVLVRTLEKHPRTGFTSEVQFNRYQKVDGGWIETEVLFYRDGKLMTEEYYTEIKTNVRIDPTEFDPLRWKEGMK